MQNSKTVICDLGTGYFKLGLAGSNFPLATFPTIVGRPILRKGASSQLHSLALESDTVVGSLCETDSGSLDTTFPVRDGVIVDRENMRHIWDHSFRAVLGLETSSPAGHSILVTEAANNPRAKRRELYQTLFEEYNFSRVKLVPQAVLTLYAQGLQTGLVVDSGDGVTHVMPVVNGYTLTHSVRRMDVAGSHITARLISLLQLGGYHLNSSADSVLARQIKEACCFVAGDRARMARLEEETTALREEYRLDNGEKIVVEKERYLAPEILFNPRQIGVFALAAHEMVFDAVYGDNTDINIRRELFGHIVLSGGTTMLRGFPTRLDREVGALLKEKVLGGDEERLRKYKMRIEDPPRRKRLVYHGASLLAKIIEKDDSQWKTREEWEEEGGEN